MTTSLVRSYASVTPGVTRSAQEEKDLAQGKLVASPELVSAGSSTHPVFGEIGGKEKEEDVDMMAGIKHDMVSRERSCVVDLETIGRLPQSKNLSHGKAIMANT